MKKSSIFTKVLIITILSICFLILGKTISNASLYLDNLDFKAQINEDGSMDVTETWKIDIDETNTLYKTFKIDKSKYSKITNVQVYDITRGISQPFEQINQEMYHVTDYCYYGLINSKGDFEIAWGTGLENSSANKTYEIKYTVTDVILKCNDYAELYWQFVGEDFEISANEITGTILLPGETETKEDIKVWGHTEGLNGTIYATDTDKVEFEINKFNSGRFVETRVLFPTEIIEFSGRTANKNILDSVIREETEWANEANARRVRAEKTKLISLIVIGLISILIDVKLIKKFFKYKEEGKDLIKLKPTQEIEYFREIPRENATPAEALNMISKRMTNITSGEIGKIFSATFLDLTLKKFIEFQIVNEGKKKDDITIKILKELTDEAQLKEDERTVYSFLKMACKYSNETTLKEFERFIKSKGEAILRLKTKLNITIERNLEKEKLIDLKVKEEYLKKTVSIFKSKLLVDSIIFTVIFMELRFYQNKINILFLIFLPTIILSIVNIIKLKNVKSKINVYTQDGIDESEKWKGLKKYMEEFSLLREREIPELVLWEKFLVYATVFGIAEKVLKQLKLVYPNFEEITSMEKYSYIYLMTNTNFSNTFSNSINSAISSAYSSASGGGGGFSGGGGGGRWPVAVAGRQIIRSINKIIKIKYIKTLPLYIYIVIKYRLE